ncbi:PssD/Cps14F family polysaccharide biosynthesis glycosyltransferase [Heyndrickxia faecalis]|uniref:PssD/Cps14F family polysaccharide biosynthesis glycosyltransferase n=1 Tax=Heyndrickxia faecalis TaxID=2824910 RepID=A0AAU7WI26_9BACI|nr:PssD/Cps14F family polysaccharide biosynthesis glycosyltransferase [Heyndrickxia coagulans]
MRITVISSTGGHWTQLNEIIKKINENKKKNDILYIVTEKNMILKNRNDIFFLKQQDRKNILFFLTMISNTIKSLYYVLKHRPNYVISTGAGVTVPYLIFAKIFKSKIIFIESFSKTRTPTITGRIIYKFADYFFIQWPTMQKIYPKAIYKGSLY